ncbi:MAG: AtpZ/AtpI family protein [Flavobacteriales bacterium]|jgi:F0F1-type ATP synthase assembly protein I
MSKNKTKKKKQLNSYIKYSSLTTQMAVIIVAGTFFGAELDKPNKSDTPIYTIIFSLISIFLALYYVFKKIINQNEKK